MYFGAPISPRPCPPSPRPEFNNSRARLNPRVYNQNSSMKNNTSLTSLNDSFSEESPIPSPQRNFTVQHMALSISPRSPRNGSALKQNDIFNKAYYKRPKLSKRTDENGSNPYFPVQPLTDEKIEKIKAILKMSYTENSDNSGDESSEVPVIEDHVVDDLLTKIENRLQGVSFKLSANGSALPSPKSTRKLPPSINSSCHDFTKFQPLQFGLDHIPKKKLRISRSPSADIEKYIKIDKNGHDDLDRKIIELKGKLSKIAELIKARNADV